MIKLCSRENKRECVTLDVNMPSILITKRYYFLFPTHIVNKVTIIVVLSTHY